MISGHKEAFGLNINKNIKISVTGTLTEAA